MRLQHRVKRLETTRPRQVPARGLNGFYDDAQRPGFMAEFYPLERSK